MTRQEEKARLRAEQLALRDAMSEAERTAANAAIFAHGLEAIAFKPDTIVSGFWPIRSEADIRPLLEALRQRGARIALPVVLDRQTIVFREVLPDAPVVKTGFGSYGPGPEAPEVAPEILLLPLSAFDAEGHRIGYGGGYYDRAIERLSAAGSAPTLIGVAFAIQEVASVPAEAHDRAMNAVLTESGLRWFRRAKMDE
ncbi:5-formyltetrahydrofolate cyclo-ligase [Xaviernesmea oryzae]|uniref:5-formyltetrahydrofolate cyclo-ligase n=1 Tax=Xaviernesmea oryzae TaxID=464029 RepID=A0A1Q9AZQ2_9HYPH|nr:5-formyltetrahydrofolate cyclo-ligase [Xaviernesmea oryzae]OLP61170.1 5-formyltetrahydrofolate cyclo-ligase [Xaviernesmea oryzae]